MSSPGATFQEEVIRSIPSRSAGGLAPWKWKLPDIPMFAQRCRSCKRGQIIRLCASCHRRENFAPRFSPRYPFDLLVSAPVDLSFEAAGLPSGIAPQILFAFELKRTQGRIAKRTGTLAARLAFDQVKDHQVTGLAGVAAGGGVAGIIWLVETGAEDSPPGAWRGRQATSHFIPVQSWIAYKATAQRKSMTLDTARMRGVEVAEDLGRGTSRRYWRMAEMMKRYGADVEAPPARPLTEERPTVFDVDAGIEF